MGGLGSMRLGILKRMSKHDEKITDEDFWRQVERAKRMTPEERAQEGLDLFDRALVMMSAGIEMQFPNATPSEIAEIRRERLRVVRRLEEVR